MKGEKGNYSVITLVDYCQGDLCVYVKQEKGGGGSFLECDVAFIKIVGGVRITFSGNRPRTRWRSQRTVT